MRFTIFLVSAALLSSAAAADPFADASARARYPELAPRAIMIGIIKGLDGSIADPRSISDVVLCPATKIKLSRNGEPQPQSWYVAFSMNSRTSSGGFGGRVMYGAIFRRGKLPEIVRTQMPTDDGFDRLINNATQKQMKDCPSVSNEQLAALVGANDRPLVDVSK